MLATPYGRASDSRSRHRAERLRCRRDGERFVSDVGNSGGRAYERDRPCQPRKLLLSADGPHRFSPHTRRLRCRIWAVAWPVRRIRASTRRLRCARLRRSSQGHRVAFRLLSQTARYDRSSASLPAQWLSSTRCRQRRVVRRSIDDLPRKATADRTIFVLFRSGPLTLPCRSARGIMLRSLCAPFVVPGATLSCGVDNPH